MTYQCVQGGTSQCSVTCGTGTAVITRTCMAYATGEQYPVALGSMTAAATQQCGNCVSASVPCQQDACETFNPTPAPTDKCNYRPNTWSLCSMSCGQGTRSRSLDCICNKGIAAPPARCEEHRAWKPAQQEACFEGACPTPAPARVTHAPTPPTHAPVTPAPIPGVTDVPTPQTGHLSRPSCFLPRTQTHACQVSNQLLARKSVNSMRPCELQTRRTCDACALHLQGCSTCDTFETCTPGQ